MCPVNFSINGAPPGVNCANVVPIFQSTREFVKGRSVCTRKQFPLTIAYAITVHKSQGMTVDRAVLDVSARDFQPGLSYVNVSRVKTLKECFSIHPLTLVRCDRLAEIRTKQEIEIYVGVM